MQYVEMKIPHGRKGWVRGQETGSGSACSKADKKGEKVLGRFEEGPMCSLCRRRSQGVPGIPEGSHKGPGAPSSRRPTRPFWTAFSVEPPDPPRHRFAAAQSDGGGFHREEGEGGVRRKIEKSGRGKENGSVSACSRR